MRRTATVTVVLLLLVACGGCGSDSGSDSPLPAPVVAAEELERLSAEADAFAERYMGVWPDVDAYVADLADDVTGADPTGRDSDGGKQVWLDMWRWWEHLTDYTIEVTGTFISTDGAAYKEQWLGLWPTDAGWTVQGPRDPAGLSYFETFVFDDGKVIVSDVWWYPQDNERFGFGCFAVDGCPALQETVDRYIAAWVERDEDAIAALYSGEAEFVDSIYGLEAMNAESIGGLAATRFGSVGELSIEVLDLFSWTDGIGRPSDRDPHHGSLLGVAIHYRATLLDEGTEYVHEAVTTLELGHRYVRDLYTHVDIDPQGLVHRETVYHEPNSLLAGLAVIESA